MVQAYKAAGLRWEETIVAVLYIREQGALLCRRSERLLVTKVGKVLLDQPLITVESISVFGNIQVTAQMLAMLLQRGIDISYFTLYGKYLGHTAPDRSKNIFLRMIQYDIYQNEERRLHYARTIVRNKITNQIRLIESHRYADAFPWREDVSEMQRHLAALDQKQTAGEILGIEGICSNIYFHSYGAMFKSSVRFEKRTRRPPKDPINVILSLAYTFLTREVSSVLEAESFEVCLGFLHGIRYGRKSLALDIVEEFRQPVVDRLVLKLFNKRMLSEYDFEEDDFDQITLNEEGFHRFCSAYEKWMNGTDPEAGEHFRSRIRQQAAELKRSLKQSYMYQPYGWKQENVPDQL